MSESIRKGDGISILGIHHVGVTVNDVEVAVRFWSALLGVEPLWRRRLDGPYLGRVTGYPGIHIEAAMLPLPGGGHMEILEYQISDRSTNPEATANPGNVHLCFHSDDVAAMFARAVELGARPVSEGPVEVTVGPNAGAVACYLRAPDGVTIEFFQPPPGHPGSPVGVPKFEHER
ncbi:MAG: VOC family protein [Actinomycetota bacterium]|nr:VOC family protein [Actinomycetota bacterium]